MIAFKLLAVVMATRLVHGLFLPNRGGAPLSRANQMMMMMKKTKIRGLTTFPNTDPRIRRSDRKCKTYRIGYYTDEYFEKWTDIPLGTVKGSKSLVSGYRFYDLKGYDAKTNKTVLFASESNVYLKNYTSEEIHRDGVDFEAMANGVLTFNDGTRLNQLYYQGTIDQIEENPIVGGTGMFQCSIGTWKNFGYNANEGKAFIEIVTCDACG